MKREWIGSTPRPFFAKSAAPSRPRGDSTVARANQIAPPGSCANAVMKLLERPLVVFHRRSCSPRKCSTRVRPSQSRARLPHLQRARTASDLAARFHFPTFIPQSAELAGFSPEPKRAIPALAERHHCIIGHQNSRSKERTPLSLLPTHNPPQTFPATSGPGDLRRWRRHPCGSRRSRRCRS